MQAAAFFVCADYWDFGSSNPCLRVGGYYNQYLDLGLFYVSYSSASSASASIGCPTLPIV